MSANTIIGLRLLRLALDVSLDEAGTWIGVSGSYLSRVERGYARLKPEAELALSNCLLREASRRGVRELLVGGALVSLDPKGLG